MRKLCMILASVFCCTQLFGAYPNMHVREDADGVVRKITFSRPSGRPVSGFPVPQGSSFAQSVRLGQGQYPAPQYQGQSWQPRRGLPEQGVPGIYRIRSVEEVEEESKQAASAVAVLPAAAPAVGVLPAAGPVAAPAIAVLPAAGPAAGTPAERPGCCALVCYALSNCFNIPGGE